MREQTHPSDARRSPEPRALGPSHRLGALLGVGRRHRVYEAIATAPGGRDGVAKVARRERRAEVAASLRAEGELLVGVRHPNVARGLHVGETPDLGPFLVRERVRGETLGDFLAREGALSVERTRTVLLGLARAIRALDAEAGSPVRVDPEDVWIEDHTERLVVVAAARGDGVLAVERRRQASAIADVLVACGRGKLEPEDTRARVRVEVVRARRAGALPSDLDPALADLFDACAVAAERPLDLAELEERLAGTLPQASGVASDPSAGPPPCRALAAEVQTLLRASAALEIARDRLPLPADLPDLMDRAARDDGTATPGSELETRLRAVAHDVAATIEESARERAVSLAAEWSSFEEIAGYFVTRRDAEGFAAALSTARGDMAQARIGEACHALGRARAVLTEARETARRHAEQQTRTEVDRLAHELDALEEDAPGIELASSLEPRRVRAEARALAAEGRFVEAVAHVKQAVAAVSEARRNGVADGLRAAAQDLADRTAALREARDDAGAAPIAAIESHLARLLERLGSGEIDEARELERDLRVELRRCEWAGEVASDDGRPSEMERAERIVAAAERERPPASPRQAAQRLALRERGEDLLARLDPARARACAPDLVERLLEHGAAAAEAERRGDHGRTMLEIESANLALAELVSRCGDAAETEAAQVGAGEDGRAVSDGGEAAPDGPPAQTDEVSPVGSHRVVDAPAASVSRSRLSLLEGGRGRWAVLALVLALVGGWIWGAAVEGGSRLRRARSGDEGAGVAFSLADGGRPLPPVGGGVSSGDLRTGGGTLAGPGRVGFAARGGVGLFPSILAAWPAGGALRATDDASHLRVALVPGARGERPDVVWWIGSRVVARGALVLPLAGLLAEASSAGAPLRVTVGDGTRPGQAHVWRVEE